MSMGMKLSGKVLAALVAVLMVFAMVPAAAVYGTVESGAGAATDACGFNIDCVVSGNQSPFTVDSTWLSDNGISGRYGEYIVTILLDNATIESTEPNTSGITIASTYEVNLIFRGGCTISGNPNVNQSAGIKVENGAILNIYGEDGATLTVTGGKYGAGIGGAGYRNPGVSNAAPGTINIYSGTIIARGGDRGAGIGSGHHQSGGVINIYGGNITAIGTGCGAGIGSGYATSGGAGEGDRDRIGDYTGGTITIQGGRIRAAAYNIIDFAGLDYYDSNTFNGTNGTFAAGIGGGYGSTSGIITIGGSADVIAVGSCGGAGIGSGRGTSKNNDYNSSCVPCNITIEGNANVVALAGKELRTNMSGTYAGGAGIGGGRGIGISGSAIGAMGEIKILDHATVLAHAGAYADGIGSGVPVTKFTNHPSDEAALLAQLQTAYESRVRANITYGPYVDVRSFIDGTEVFTTRHIVNTVNGQVDGSIYRINGDTVTVSAIVPAGKTFAGWQSDEVTFADASSETTTFTMVGSDVTVSAILNNASSGHRSHETKEPEKVETPEETLPDVTFGDIDGNEWFAESVAWVAKRGIMTGMGGGKFMPNLLANRAQIAQLLYNLDGKKTADSSVSFKDVRPSDWYAKSVSWLIESAIAQGMGESFGALENVSREQLAVMLYNYAKLKGYDVSLSGSIDSFEDSASVSPWAKNAVSWAVESGIITGTSYGYGNAILDPQGSATRAQIAVMIERFCERIIK